MPQHAEVGSPIWAQLLCSHIVQEGGSQSAEVAHPPLGFPPASSSPLLCDLDVTNLMCAVCTPGLRFSTHTICLDERAT